MASTIRAPNSADVERPKGSSDRRPSVEGTPSTKLSPQASSKAIRRASTMKQYANESIFTDLAYNPYFDACTITVIVLNAGWLGVDVNWNHNDMKDESGKLPLEPASFIVENVFCAYFTFEVVVRFFSFRQKWDCIFDAWFVFDSILVIMMIVETWIMTLISHAVGGGAGADVLANLSVFRLLRLLRLTRMVRLMKAVPELLTLVKSIIKAAKAVSWVLFFLFMVLYVFGILFTVQMADAPRSPKEGYTDLLGETARSSLSPHLANLAPLLQAPGSGDGCEEEGDPLAGDLFATLGDSMMNLFTRGILGDNLQETCDAIKAESDVMQGLFFVFFGLTFVLFLNMLIGVLCEVVSQASADEADTICFQELKASIEEAFKQIDTNKDGVVCRDEWKAIKDQAQVRSSMVGIGVEETSIDEQLQDMTELMFQTEDIYRDVSESSRVSHTRDGRVGFTVEQLIDRVMEFRPGQAASALDLEIVKAKVSIDNQSLKRKLDRLETVVLKALGPRYVDDSEPDNFGASSCRSSEANMSALGSDRVGEREGASISLPGAREDALRQAAAAPPLEDIPTDLLFSELQRRTAPMPGSNPPNHLRT